MTRNHRRKSRAHRRREGTGSSYASAAAGATHRHPGPRVTPLRGVDFGRQIDLSAAGALVAAACAGCEPCQRSRADAVLAGDRLVVAQLAGAVYAPLPVPGFLAAETTRRFHGLVRAARASGDGRPVLALVERLDASQLEDLLEDALDLWAAMADDAGAGRASEDTGQADGQAEAPAGSAGSAKPGGPGGSVDDQEGDVPDAGHVAVAGRFGAYALTAGADLGEDEVLALLRVAEASAAGGPPITCSLCDERIDVTAEELVHIGLITCPAPGGGEVLIPAWTHPGCGRARLWTPDGLDAERERRGLPTSLAATLSGTARRQASTGGQEPRPHVEAHVEAEEDYTLFSLATLPSGVHPLLVIQPGRPHEHGLDGHLADLRSMGLRPVRLDGSAAPAELGDWQVRVERGRLTALTRRGAGTWYRQEGGHPVPGQWRQAARKQRTALVILLPHGTFRDGADLPGVLARAARQGQALGGLMAVRGTLS